MVYNNIREYIEVQLDLFILLVLKNKKTLKGKLRQVYIEHIVCAVEGKDINDTNIIGLITKRLGYDFKTDIYQYRGKLAKSGWLISDRPEARGTKADYKIIPNFDFYNKEFKYSKKYSFSITLNGNTVGEEK